MLLMLRRRLLTQLIDRVPELGGWLKILFDLEGEWAIAETVLPTTAEELIKVLFDGNANIAELTKATNGAGQIQKVVFDGYAIMSQTFVVDGNVEFLLDLLGKLDVAELSKQCESMLVVCIPTRAEWSTTEATGVDGSVDVNTNVDGLLVVAYQYTTEENNAGGTTYNIISDYRYDSEGTVYIGGRDGSQ